MKNIKELSNDALLQELMDWTRIYRNEEQLLGEERQYYQALAGEVRDRKLLPSYIHEGALRWSE
jgi:hypothetical protein